MYEIVVFLLKIYRRTISPFKTPSCRFFPSCSLYALQALSKYGLWKGLFLIVKRLLRCHSFCSGGYDPVN